MALLFLHGLKNTLNFHTHLGDQNEASLPFPINLFLPKTEESQKKLKTLKHFSLIQEALVPIQFATQNSLFSSMFLPYLPLLGAVGLTSFTQFQPENVINEKDLKNLCMAVHTLSLIYFFSTDQKMLAFGMLFGHLLTQIDFEDKTKKSQYDFFLMLTNSASTLLVGSIYERIYGLISLLINYPTQTAQVIEWIKRLIPQK